MQRWSWAFSGMAVPHLRDDVSQGGGESATEALRCQRATNLPHLASTEQLQVICGAAAQLSQGLGCHTCAMGECAVVLSLMTVMVVAGAKSTAMRKLPCCVSMGAKAKWPIRAGQAPGLAAPGGPRVMQYCSAMLPPRSCCTAHRLSQPFFTPPTQPLAMAQSHLCTASGSCTPHSKPWCMASFDPAYC